MGGAGGRMTAPVLRLTEERRDTFVCEGCDDRLPCLGHERRRAPKAERSSEDYPNRLCAWCADRAGLE
jgi:hypothetical protein